jgi:hypothetical protein
MILFQRMAKSGRGIYVVLLLMILLGALTGGVRKANAESSGRQTTIVVPYTEYEWWLIRWHDNQISCRVLVDHEGLPTYDEVLKSCGPDYAEDWLDTPPCKQIVRGNPDIAACSGVYLHFLNSKPSEREVVITLPEPTVWVSLVDCAPIPPDNFCSTMPNLLLTGEEPLPNERIVAIQGTYDGQPFYCEGDQCKLPLKVTPVQGVTVEFWADSSYGDSSEKYTAQVRVIDTGVSSAPGGSGYYVDVLSSQWRGDPLASCAKSWEVFPPVGGLPEWLSTPNQIELLTSDETYYYLAGRLIAQGVVNASSCPTGGMLPNGYADACGLEAAQPAVESWQNQFDASIITATQTTGIPAQLLKNLFAQESQFWPGVFRVPYEYGLGQITDKGADAILLWNEPFYDQFCPLVLTEEACSEGYLKLKPADQAMLRGALALQAKTDCADCVTGVDLTHTNVTVELFAQTMKANCEQVNQIVRNATEQTPGTLSSYEDLWRFTVANYHAGPGCLSYAINMAWQSSPGLLTWDKVSGFFTETCKGVIPYVEKITQIK